MTPESDRDKRWMRIAIREAQKGLGTTNPNPAVGAVVVKFDRILAKGHHRRAGRPHAEIEALRRLRHQSFGRNSTLYVTLEPCSTAGRTPACTEAIIRAGVRRVVIGSVDPNPKHLGQGITYLREAGIEVTSGVLGPECEELNVGFNRWITTGRPWVIAKVGQSLDGRLTRPAHESQWLTSPLSRHRSHQLRSTVHAILVGAETIRNDDPALTVRNIRGARQPLRVVVSRSGRLPTHAKIFTDRQRERTVVFVGQDWEQILLNLGGRGVTRLLVEGGSEVIGQLLDRRLIDEFWSFLAPMLTGGNKPTTGGTGTREDEPGFELIKPRMERLGNDVLIRGYLSSPYCFEAFPQR